MADQKVSLPQRALLLILMAENAELSNRQIKEKYAPGLELTGKPRTALIDAKLIECRKENNAYFFTLSEEGWRWCREELTRAVPPGAGSAGHALYAVLGGLDRYLERTNHSLAQVFGNQAEAEPEPKAGLPAESRPAAQPQGARPAADEIEREIRLAYMKLADSPGSWVGLAEIRDQVVAFARPEVDGVLRLMARMTGVQIEEETNQKALTNRDRAAAVHIGGRDQHVLAIGGR
jgi:hypothetical protein